MVKAGVSRAVVYGPLVMAIRKVRGGAGTGSIWGRLVEELGTQ